ncbi:MAG: D-alanyl-D-alanine-carboxypeptidase/endopeptidase AmpH [Hyphomicrobiales bacterium]|nr:D-alanyl-D-alanine-carboxypeptidase/endopeptidase AmpH [Hyphomicrobiales bacterium]MBV9909307.1 D-alanyl-D-alanine-carboxypeptidase/endopeptidase AmpH [Hyphomicrobiales bacterium]
MMRRRDVLGLLTAASLPWSHPARASQALLDESVGFAGQILFLSLKVPALVIGVIRDGQTSIQGFGRRADTTNEAPGADTLFRIGSVTKSFAGQVLASLAADGIVSLADPLTKYCPEFASQGSQPIRLIDLVTHSAGLPREVPHDPGPPDYPFVNITPDAFTGWLRANPLMFAPGTAISYSNFGFDLLAAALARAAGKPYADLLDARVIRPLGLRDTAFAPSAEQAARIMAGHNFDGSPMPNAKTGDVIVGSGGLYSSARDLLAWLKWHLDRFSTERASERLIDHAAYLWRDGLSAVFGMDESGHMDAMGLAWVIMEPERDRPLILQKAGGLQGVFSYVAFAPSRGIGVCMAINAFDLAAGLAIAKTANDLIAELAPR